MARAEEKKFSMLNRWWSMKQDVGIQKKIIKKPRDCTDITLARNYYEKVLGEMNELIVNISYEHHDFPAVEEMNRQINRLDRRKREWEARILELGGLAVLSQVKIPEALVKDPGQIIPSKRSYFKYYGYARKLPSVRAFFELPDSDTEPEVKEEVVLSKVDELPVNVANATLFYYGFNEEQMQEDVLQAERQLRAAWAIKFPANVLLKEPI